MKTHRTILAALIAASLLTTLVSTMTTTARAADSGAEATAYLKTEIIESEYLDETVLETDDDVFAPTTAPTIAPTTAPTAAPAAAPTAEIISDIPAAAADLESAPDPTADLTPAPLATSTEDIPEEPPAATIEITLDARNGYITVYTDANPGIPQHVQTTTITVAQGQYADLDVPVLNNDPDYEFAGWETDDHRSVETDTPYQATKSETLHAVYVYKPLIHLNAGLHGLIVAQDACSYYDWSGRMANIKVVGDLQLAIDHIRHVGYRFLGWAKTPESTTVLEPALPLEDGVIYYAIYGKCNHDWYAGLITTKATCTRYGSRECWCKVCGLEDIMTIKPLGHKYGAYKITKAATALDAGSKYRICSVCKYKQTVAIPHLTPTIAYNASSLTMQQKQVLKTFKVKMTTGDYVVAWKSSNTNIVTVYGGTGSTNGKAGTCVITAKSKNGTAYIAATLKSGLKKAIKVTVQSGKVATTYMRLTAPVPPTSRPTVASLTLAKGKYYPIKVKRAPLTANEKITYYSNNKAVATVSTTGVIKAIKAGSAVVTVTSGTKKVYVKVTVK